MVNPAGPSDELSIRRATDADRGAVIALCRSSLGWIEDDPNEEFFAWKHDENPFGASPAWLAVAPDGSLAGLRVLMRWRFRDGGGETISAVRAVDTATHPDWQGKGIFTRLTLGALEELADDGLDVVFNTPNDKSRPGYLKMGWSQVGRVPVAVRLRSMLAAPAMRGARAAAEKWSRPTQAAAAATEVFADTEGLEALLQRCGPTAGARQPRITTDRSVEYLRWRYSFTPLHYRALPLGDALADGLVVFRVRRRGTATELTVCEVLAPPQGKPNVGRAVAYLLRASGADYAIRVGATSALKGGFVPVPQLGPTLTWRPVNRSAVPRMGDLDLALGDVELF